MSIGSPDLLVRLRWRRALRGLRERAHDAAARELDLEGIVRVASRLTQQHVRHAGKGRAIGRLSAQRRFRRRMAPRLARLALGGVAHKPWRHPAAEAALRGEAAHRATFTRVADVRLAEARGYAHNSFKIELARRGIVRALTQAAQGTPQSQSDKKIR